MPGLDKDANWYQLIERILEYGDLRQTVGYIVHTLKNRYQ